ncbi:hypothetical protein FACS189464_3480 [Bacteroidia bacterium]|nr:hypothetical protein FACS189464_3480 [Bacteroidia bacterium]
MKKVFWCICAVAIVAAVGVNVSVGLNGEKSKFSDLTLKNIEALGQYSGGESGGGCSGCTTVGCKAIAAITTIYILGQPVSTTTFYCQWGSANYCLEGLYPYQELIQCL